VIIMYLKFKRFFKQFLTSNKVFTGQILFDIIKLLTQF